MTENTTADPAVSTDPAAPVATEGESATAELTAEQEDVL